MVPAAGLGVCVDGDAFPCPWRTGEEVQAVWAEVGPEPRKRCRPGYSVMSQTILWLLLCYVVSSARPSNVDAPKPSPGLPSLLSLTT